MLRIEKQNKSIIDEYSLPCELFAYDRCSMQHRRLFSFLFFTIPVLQFSILNYNTSSSSYVKFIIHSNLIANSVLNIRKLPVFSKHAA